MGVLHFMVFRPQINYTTLSLRLDMANSIRMLVNGSVGGQFLDSVNAFAWEK
jgi:hypothetical protein